MDNPEDFNELENMMEEESHRKTRTVLVCPQCDSTHVTYFMGMKTGVQYQCKECGYVGSFIIEREMDK